MSVLFKSTGRGNDEDDEKQLRAALDTVIRRIGEPSTTRRRMERHEGSVVSVGATEQHTDQRCEGRDVCQSALAGGTTPKRRT